MELNQLINEVMNIVAPPVIVSMLIHFLPVYVFLMSLLFIYSSVFSENVAGKVVLITGASSGIGEHLAYEYARRGACLVLAARREKSLREVAERARLLGSPEVITLPTDVSKVEDCRRLIDDAVYHFGQLDHLVSNARIAPVCMFEDSNDVSNFAPVMDINFWGSVYVTHFAVPYLRESNGKIIVIASSAAWLNAPRLSFYSASKAAVISMFETLRVEFGSDIGVTIVTPGLIGSEMTKGKFLSKKGELKVDQQMRDVEMSVIPVETETETETETVQVCAKAIVNSACRGDRYLTEPSWIKMTIFWKVLWPEMIEWCNRLFLITRPTTSQRETATKRILNQTGLQKYMYPASILCSDIKVNGDH